MRKRVVFSVLLLVSAVLWPLWLTAILAILGIIYFPMYIEAIFALLMSDLLFGAPESKFLGGTFVSSLSVVVALILVEFLKKKLKFYPEKLN
ncbi:MAG TPA: hypothetical protein VG694_00095 [Candidatus Paceibacterota bacterium]|jgi:hypothetical protein|nr:hypothetical protein [Candidatus Paceibacterota bacterium]